MKPNKLIEVLRRQKHALRVALTAVKVDHINKKVSLPLKTHGLVENTLADTLEELHEKKVTTRQIRARKTGIPKFKIRKHRTPRSLLQQFTKESGWAIEDIQFGDLTGKHEIGGPDMVEMIAEQGFWGFTETHAVPPVIHFWSDGKQTEEVLTRFFGHEMGHNLGEPLEDEEEEYRADDYGHVAVLAGIAARKACRGS
jgi:hypothetical protein